ncbi:hypothetical protein [Thioalkalivibrio thiocyanodenitrificans]|uniref:hypothetical protein n=1 Tax=Thioalkalivibrio thiocyanodenitrificans TaxID=243063 RepID=UPI00037E7F34|nr:hypothetical protein [Thioalkalivibrio thiocyanodenitrificans]
MNHTKKIRITLAAACAFGLATGPGQALEIDPHVAPQVDIGGRALITTKAHRVKEADGGTDSDSELEFADSSLLFGFSKYLFDSENYAFGAIGIKAIEDDAHHDVRDDIYLHQMHAGVGGERFEVVLGRTGLPNTLVVFPTLRDDDLMDFTHVGNAFSHAPDEVYQLYGGVVQGTLFWPAQRMSATGTITARTETDGTGSRTSSSEFNGYNLKFAYDVPEAIKFDRGLRYTALAWDRQDLNDGEGEMDAFQAGAVINLSDNPEATWNLDLQATYVNGISVPDLASIANRSKAEQKSVAAAIRYGHRPWLQTRWQAAVTVGWKDYDDFSDASAWTVAPSLMYRLGSGIHALAQYQYRSNSSGLADATGVDNDQRIYLGLSFDFDHTLNKHVAGRDSIMFLEHNMLDVGPARGGH